MFAIEFEAHALWKLQKFIPAHVANQVAWVEAPGFTGVFDQKCGFGASMYPF